MLLFVNSGKDPKIPRTLSRVQEMCDVKMCEKITSDGDEGENWDECNEEGGGHALYHLAVQSRS